MAGSNDGHPIEREFQLGQVPYRTYADLIFEQKRDMDGRRQDAVDAIAFLEAHGVVSTPGFFWYADSGERLVDAIRRKHETERFRAAER